MASWTARANGLWPLKQFSLVPQSSAASSCHQTLLPSPVYHPPRLQSRSGAHAGTSLPLHEERPRRRPTQIHPAALHRHLPTAPTNPCTAAVGAYSQACCLGASLQSCKNFIVELRPRLFSRLASPLTGKISCAAANGCGLAFWVRLQVVGSRVRARACLGEKKNMAASKAESG